MAAAAAAEEAKTERLFPSYKKEERGKRRLIVTLLHGFDAVSADCFLMRYIGRQQTGKDSKKRSKNKKDEFN